MRGVPKFDYVRSKRLMEAYRLIPCQHCGADDGTVCGAHSNWAEHGKGRSIKASDIYCASLCSICHHQLDAGFMWNNEQKRAMWQAAHERTVRKLRALGVYQRLREWPVIEALLPAGLISTTEVKA